MQLNQVKQGSNETAQSTQVFVFPPKCTNYTFPKILNTQYTHITSTVVIPVSWSLHFTTQYEKLGQRQKNEQFQF